MKLLVKLTLCIVIFASTSLLYSQPGDECDVKHPYHPIVQDAKLISSFAKIWWISDKMIGHAKGDAEQQRILKEVQDKTHELKEMLIKALIKRVKETDIEETEE